MNVAVARPTSALKNTSFEGQLKCYEYLASEFNFDIDVLCRADSNLSTNVTEVDLIEVSQTPIEKVWHYFREGMTKFLDINDNVNMPVYSRVQSIIQNREYDVVEVSDPRLYETAHLVYQTLLNTETRLVVVASASKNLSSPIPTSSAAEVIEAATGMLLVSPRTHNNLTKMGLVTKEDQRVEYTGHPIDTNTFSPSDYGSQEPINFLSVGHLEGRKGYQDICRAFCKVADDIDFEWHIVGSGELEKWIAKKSEEEGIGDRVTFHGRVDHEEIPTYYDQADVFVLHSKETDRWEEYFGVVYAEAMSSGLPVIGSQSGAVPWVVRDGKDGILSREGDIDGLADAIIEFGEHPEKRRRFGENGRQNVLDRFTVQAVAKKFKRAWEKDPA